MWICDFPEWGDISLNIGELHSVNAWDIKVSMLSSILLANIRILSCFFFLFLVILNKFLIIPVVREKSKVRLALLIPAGAPTTLADEMIQTSIK